MQWSFLTHLGTNWFWASGHSLSFASYIVFWIDDISCWIIFVPLQRPWWEQSERQAWIRGSGLRGLAHKIKAAEYTERDRSRSRALSLYSLVFIPGPPGFCLCKLYWGDLINADPDRSQSRHNNLAWQRYRVLFVMIIVPLITESQ